MHCFQQWFDCCAQIRPGINKAFVNIIPQKGEMLNVFFAENET